MADNDTGGGRLPAQVRVKIRSAQAGKLNADDRVVGSLDLGIGTIDCDDVPSPSEDQGSHRDRP